MQQAIADAAMSLRAAIGDFPDGLLLAPISGSAIIIADSWMFDWQSEYNRWSKETRRFGVAIWANHVLCGIAIGKANRAKINVSVTLLEGNPDTNLR